MTDDAEFCVSLLKALADETRLGVVRQLIDGPKTVGQMMRALKVEQSLLSHHLKVLRETELVTAERVGSAVIYRLAPGAEATQSHNAVNLGCCVLAFD